MEHGWHVEIMRWTCPRQCSWRPVNLPPFHQPPRTGCAQPAGEDLVLLSTPMSSLTDNTGLMDWSIIARGQGKQQEDNIIYVLNCSYSTRGLHHLSSGVLSAAPRKSSCWVIDLNFTRVHAVPAARAPMWLYGWPLWGRSLTLRSAVEETVWIFV